MNKKIIEKYIQFGIDNWWENVIMSDLEIKKQIKPSCKFLKERLNIHISYMWDDEIRKEFIINSNNLYKYIMKKEFIEAIARWLSKKMWLWEPNQEEIQELCKTQALFIAWYWWKETFEDFILSIIK